MFKLGSWYKITTWELGVEGETFSESYWKLENVQGTLISLSNPNSKPLILNTASVSFISAEEDTRERSETNIDPDPENQHFIDS